MSKDYDPPMHSAEHILNRTMVSMFGCGRSFSSHLNTGKSKCDYHFDRDLTDDECAELEKRINAQIARNLPITTEMADWSKAVQLVDVSKLPASVNPNDKLRLVHVGNYDVCACIGEHVENTAEIGSFRLLSHSFTPAAPATPADAPDKTGVLRLRFKLGA